jgi:hypothetical protein
MISIESLLEYVCSLRRENEMLLRIKKLLEDEKRTNVEERDAAKAECLSELEAEFVEVQAATSNDSAYSMFVV